MEDAHPEDVDVVRCCGRASDEQARMGGAQTAAYADEWAAALVVLLSAAPGIAAADRDHHDHELALMTTLAPVQPDGLSVGAPTDFLVSFAEPDPNMPGISLEEGATLRLRLPQEFVNTGDKVAGAAEPGCGAPKVVDCSTAVLVQGWPQSPVPPFPDVNWEADTNTFVLTATADWRADPPAAPGPKTLHLTALGFRNPDRAGQYPVELEIQPDPNVPTTRKGRTTVRITRRVPANVSVVSTVNGAPPPPFPNSIYQTVARDGGAPIDLLTYGLYLWGRDAVPLVGAEVRMRTRRSGLLVDRDRTPVGVVRIRAPRSARDYTLTSDVAVPTAAAITGVPTALLRADLSPDPDVAGDYVISVTLFGGNTQRLFVTVR